MRKFLFSIVALFFLIGLSGCLDVSPRMNPTGPEIHNSPDLPAPVKEALDGNTEAIKKQIDTSQNAIQQNMQQLLGVNVAKLSDQLVKATIDMKDLVHAEISNKIGDIQNQMTASLASGNELRVMLKNQMSINAKLQAQLTLSLKANIGLQSMVDAKIQGVAAGIAGKIDTTTSDLKQNIQAGRDVKNINQQFTKEDLEAIQGAQRVLLWILLGAFAAVVLIVYFVMNKSVNTANANAGEARTQLHSAQATLNRAMSFVPSEHHDKIFPKAG